MSRKNKVKMFKIILLILALIIIVGAIIYLFPVIRKISTTQGQIEFKEKIQSSGILGMLSLLGLQIAQIFLFIIPGEPIEILAGMCYGALWGTIFILISSFAIKNIYYSRSDRI